MFSHISVSNTINKLFNNATIVYLGKQNLFYRILTQNPYYNIINNTEQPFIGMIHDDPLLFSHKSNELELNYHAYSWILFHNPAPAALKKEDKHILATKLKNSIKIFFSDMIRKSWGLYNDTNSYSITYGCEVKHGINHTKNIAVLNLDNNKIINDLYRHIHNIFPDSDLLKSISDTTNIDQYRLVVSLENIYDALYSAANGCFVLSNTDLQNNLPSVYKITDINKINEQISQILSAPIAHIIETQQFIQNNFDLQTHYESMNNIFSLAKNRAYLYEA